jgi:predicted NAD-dependent protein-ADP-ribosyltransferase YbiA (DUF1768 family)
MLVLLRHSTRRPIGHLYGGECSGLCLVCKVDMRIFDRPELENERRILNFTESPIHVEGKEYACSEEFFQKSKPTPFDVETWQPQRDEVMRKALRAKFSSNIPLRDFLVSTFPHQLLSLKKDIYWAFDPDTGCGDNVLAEMLMQLRNEFVEEDAAAATAVEGQITELEPPAAKADGKDPKQRLSTANFKSAPSVIPFAAPMQKAAEAAKIHSAATAAKRDRQSAKEAKSLEDTLMRADWRCLMLTTSKEIDLAIQAKSKHSDEQKVFTKRHHWFSNASEVLMGLIKAKFPQMLLLDAAHQKDLIRMLAKECYETLELSHQTELYGMSIKRLLREQGKSDTGTGTQEERKLTALSVVAVNLQGSKEVSSCYFSTVIFSLVKNLPLRSVPELLDQWKVIVDDDSYLRRKCLGDSC